MHSALSYTPDSASGVENWHTGTLPDAFGSFVGDLEDNFACVPPADWAESALAARAVIDRHIGNTRLLDGMRYVMRCAGYSRVLLHADPAGRFCVLGLVWPPGCLTPIHAHLTWCALGLHNGTLEEDTFEPWENGQTAPGALVATRSLRPGQTCCDSSDGRFVHRLANRSGGFAMSLHIYGAPQARIAEGVNRILSGA